MKLTKGKKTIAALVVTGAVAASGLSAAAIASAQSSGSSSVEAQEAPVTAPAGAINPDQAVQAAEQETGQTASSVELDDENGTVLYEVKAGDSEVKVDSMSGQVTKVESAGADNESTEGETAGSGTEDNGADGEVDDDSGSGQQSAGDDESADEGSEDNGSNAAGSGQEVED